MANIHLSPGVYTFERDLSQYAPKLSTTIVGMVGVTERGPTNRPVLTTNMSQWIQTFGKPKDAYPYSALAAEQYFQWGNILYTVRVVPEDAKVAEYKIAPLFCENADPYSGIDSDNYMMKFSVSGKSIIIKLDATRSLVADSAIQYPVVIGDGNRVLEFPFISIDGGKKAYYVIAKGVYNNASSLAVALNKAFETGYASEITFNENEAVTTPPASAISNGKIKAVVSGGKIMLRSSYDFAFKTNTLAGSTLGFGQKIICSFESPFVIPASEHRYLKFSLPTIMGGIDNYIDLYGGAAGVSYTPAELVSEINQRLRRDIKKSNGNTSYAALGLLTAVLVDEFADTASFNPTPSFRYSIKINSTVPVVINSAPEESTIFAVSPGSFLSWSENQYSDVNKYFTAQEIADIINTSSNGDLLYATTYSVAGGKALLIQAYSDMTVDYINNNCYEVLGIANDAGETNWTVGSKRTIFADTQKIFGNSIKFNSKETFTVGTGANTLIVRIGEDIDEERTLRGYNNVGLIWDCKGDILNLEYLDDEAGASVGEARQNINNYYSIYRIKFPVTAYGTYTASKMCKVLNDTIKFDQSSDASNWERLVFIKSNASNALPYPKWIKNESTAPPIKFIQYNGSIIAVCQAINPHLNLLNPYYNAVDMKFGQSVAYYTNQIKSDEFPYSESINDFDSLGSVLGYSPSEATPSNTVELVEALGASLPTSNYYLLSLGAGGTLADASQVTNPVIDAIRAKNAGEWGNNLRVVIFYSEYTGCNISINEYNADEAEWVEVERFSNVVFQEEMKDTSHTYIGDIKSRYIDIDLSPEIPYDIAPEFPIAGVYRLGGGFDGTVSGDLTSEIIGSPKIVASTGWPTGLQCFADPEKIDVNTLIIPFYGTVFWEAGIAATSLCEKRGDCMYIWDAPQGLSVQDVIDWHNGEYAGGPETSLNSSYAALYWPWIKVYDQYNRKNRWCPPSGLIAGQYAFNDNVAETWYAPAGLRRGHISLALDTEYVPTLGERDMLYGNGNAVNPVVDFRKEGITIWGQRTLQRMPSALDRVNVRRLLLYLRKVIATVSMYFVFEPNDEFTWNAWKSAVGPFLDDVKRRRGLEEYKLQMDATTVNEQARSENRMPGKIFIVPTKSAEMIEIAFVINRSGNLGVDFEE